METQRSTVHSTAEAAVLHGAVYSIRACRAVASIKCARPRFASLRANQLDVSDC